MFQASKKPTKAQASSSKGKAPAKGKGGKGKGQGKGKGRRWHLLSTRTWFSQQKKNFFFFKKTCKNCFVLQRTALTKPSMHLDGWFLCEMLHFESWVFDQDAVDLCLHSVCVWVEVDKEKLKCFVEVMRVFFGVRCGSDVQSTILNESSSAFYNLCVCVCFPRKWFLGNCLRHVNSRSQILS